LGELRVLTTASSKNFDLVKGLGADKVFDYRDEGVVEKIRAATGNALNIAIDTISERKTPEQITGGIGDKGGKVAIINPYESPRPGVKVTFSMLTDLLRRVRLVRPITFVTVSLITSFSRDQAASGTSIYSKRSSLQETSSLSRFSYNPME
jgi:NADPH:quinone reductase-like Zn-dependent oxidoreductase